MGVTYTQFVSTMNHLIAGYGCTYVLETVDSWFKPEDFTTEAMAYAVGLIEYCCEKAEKSFPEHLAVYKDFTAPERVYPKSIEMLTEIRGESYKDECWQSAIECFKKHNVCVMEVGNAI